MYSKILLPVDLEHEESGRKTLDTAMQLCKDSDATLHLLAVNPDFGMSIIEQYFPDDFEQQMADRTLERLKAFADENVADGIDVQHIVASGKVYEIVLRVADEIGADLIVVGAQRPGKEGFLLGRNSARVARHAACSVLVVRG